MHGIVELIYRLDNTVDVTPTDSSGAAASSFFLPLVCAVVAFFLARWEGDFELWHFTASGRLDFSLRDALFVKVSGNLVWAGSNVQPSHQLVDVHWNGIVTLSLVEQFVAVKLMIPSSSRVVDWATDFKNQSFSRLPSKGKILVGWFVACFESVWIKDFFNLYWFLRLCPL